MGRHAPRPSRRQVLRAAAVVGLGAAAAGCAPAATDTTTAQPSGPAAAPTRPTVAPGSPRPSASGTPGTALGPIADVPVGGGTIYPAQKVVVTQPVMGVFKGFSAVCPHEGCLVSTVADGRIDCPCHGSQFSIMDGSRLAGPAPNGLAYAYVTESGTELVLHT